MNRPRPASEGGGTALDIPLTACINVGAALLGIGVGATLLAEQLPHLL